MEKVKTLKNDLQRKDQIIRDVKSQVADTSVRTLSRERSRLHDQSTSSTGPSAETSVLIEELKKKNKEQRNKHKMELQVKDNTIRALRSKIEQQEESIQQLKQEVERKEKNHEMPMQMKAQILEKQHKRDKNKLKKYDLVVKESLGALQMLGEQLSQ